MQTFFPLFNRQRAPDPPIAYHIYPAQQSYPISNYPNNYHYHNPYYNIDESELHISDQHLSSDEYQNSTSEGPVCCPHEIQKSKVHKVSPNSRVRKQLFMADRNRLPKFRDPWRYLDQSTQSHTEQPLSRDEARRIREIWQDTRAQYDPSDHEIEEEYLYEEEYNDENAERRRIELVEKGAKEIRENTTDDLTKALNSIKATDFDDLVKQIKKIDLEEVKEEFEVKLENLKAELADLDKEKVLEIAKKKAAELKEKAQELVQLAVDKGTPILRDMAEEVRLKTIDVTKDVLKKLENADKK